MLVEKASWQTDNKNILATICAQIPFPIIVKPHDDGCSVMVQKARSEKELADAINTLFANEKTSALIEECIIGMELTVGVLGNEEPRALPPSQALSAADVLSMQEKFLPVLVRIKPPHLFHNKQRSSCSVPWNRSMQRLAAQAMPASTASIKRRMRAQRGWSVW